MSGKRSQKYDKLARIYDEEILPLWSQRFGRMMLRGLELPPKAMVLDVGTGTGHLALELLRKLDDQGRIIAIDGASVMLDVARKKAGDLSGKRIFFRTEEAFPKLPFTADVYDAVLCNLGLTETATPRAALRDFARVTKPDGQVIVTLPLAGTFAEFYDIFREVLVKHDKHEMLDRLDKHLASYPEPDEAERWLASAGLANPRVDVEEFTLLFRSSREFFFAPVIEFGPLPRWKEIAGARGEEMQDVFWYIKQAIDAYFGGRAFQVTVKAGCLRGTKRETPPDTDRFEKLEVESEEEPQGEWSTGDVPLVSGDDNSEQIEAFRDDEPEDDGS